MAYPILAAMIADPWAPHDLRIFRWHKYVEKTVLANLNVPEYEQWHTFIKKIAELLPEGLHPVPSDPAPSGPALWARTSLAQRNRARLAVPLSDRTGAIE